MNFPKPLIQGSSEPQRTLSQGNWTLLSLMMSLPIFSPLKYSTINFFTQACFIFGILQIDFCPCRCMTNKYLLSQNVGCPYNNDRTWQLHFIVCPVCQALLQTFFMELLNVKLLLSGCLYFPGKLLRIYAAMQSSLPQQKWLGFQCFPLLLLTPRSCQLSRFVPVPKAWCEHTTDNCFAYLPT
jgi:hypothetical protein